MDVELVRQRTTRRRGGLREPRRRRGRPSPRGGAQDPARHRPRRGRDAAGAAEHLAGPPASSATRRTLTPGRTGSSCAPATPRAGRTRQWMPNLRLLPADEPRRPRRAWARSSIATSSSAASAACPSTIARWWSCTTTSTCRSTRSPRRSASPSGRSDPVCIMRCAGCARPSRPTRDPRRGRRCHEHRSRDHAHRSVVAGGGRDRAARTASWTPCSTKCPRPHSAVPGGRRGGSRDMPTRLQARRWRPPPCSSSRSSGSICCPATRRWWSGATPTPSPSPSASSSQSPPASPVLFPNGPLPAGSHTIQPFVGPGGLCVAESLDAGCTEAGAEDDSIRITLTVPDGWSGLESSIVPVRRGLLATRRRGFELRARRLAIPLASCAGTRHQPTGGPTIPTGTTVDAFVTALVDHPDLDVTSPVGCHPGRATPGSTSSSGRPERHHRRAGPDPSGCRPLRVGTRDLRPGAERPVAHLGT